MTSFVKNGLILLGILVIGGLGYYLFVLNSDADLVVSTTTTNAAQLASEQFLRELNTIKTVNLSGDLFSDPRFLSLTDFSEPLVEKSVGRNNPFFLAQ